MTTRRPSPKPSPSTLMLCAAILLAATTSPVAGDSAEPIEAMSLLGRALARPDLPAQSLARHENALGALRERLATHPHDADALIWVGRQLGYLGRYREAIEIFHQGVERFPEDARFLRHRGHRRISIRDLEGAVDDLQAGIALMAGRPDAVESDGLPNLYNQPTGSLKTNLWYHLGLAHYLRGDFQQAAESYTACAALADNPDMHVAASYWLYLSLRRLSRDAEAAAVLAATPLNAVLLENDGYQDLLRLLSAGPEAHSAATELLSRHEPGTVGAVTLSYGVGVWHLLAGRSHEAYELFGRVADGNGWAGFGFLAAEAELARRLRD